MKCNPESTELWNSLAWELISMNLNPVLFFSLMFSKHLGNLGRYSRDCREFIKTDAKILN